MGVIAFGYFCPSWRRGCSPRWGYRGPAAAHTIRPHPAISTTGATMTTSTAQNGRTGWQLSMTAAHPLLLAALQPLAAQANDAPACLAATGTLLMGRVTSGPKFKHDMFKKGVEVPHTHLRLRADADGTTYDVVIDNVFADGVARMRPATRPPARSTPRSLSGLGSGLRRGEFRCQPRRRRGVGLRPTTSRQRRMTSKIAPALRVEAGNGLIRRCECAPCRQAWLCFAPRLSPLPASTQARPQARQAPGPQAVFSRSSNPRTAPNRASPPGT